MVAVRVSCPALHSFQLRCLCPRVELSFEGGLFRCRRGGRATTQNHVLGSLCCLRGSPRMTAIAALGPHSSQTPPAGWTVPSLVFRQVGGARFSGFGGKAGE